ncbi:MAG: hypothetical protein ACRD47_07260 [Nitrososphaeraceae archaeon]
MKHNKNKRLTDESNHKVIDLASALQQQKEESKTYICSECGTDLVQDTTFRLRNPHGGEGYYCPNINNSKRCSLFGKVLDISLEKLKVKPRPVKGAISNLKDATQEVMIDFIQENKGMVIEEDEYKKYDPEPNEDERLRLSGAEIIRSKIILTDSEGRNRTIAKRS